MKSVIKLFVLSFFLLACGEKKENRIIIRKTTKWENGNIRSEGFFINDSIKEGLFKRYYRSGKLEAEGYYHENKIVGTANKYFENGNKMNLVQYKDGIRSGFEEEYFEGGGIKLYQAYNRKGEGRFRLEFLENGKIKSVFGTPVVDYSTNRENFKVGDTLRIAFLVATPKNSKIQFHFYENFTTKQNGKDLEVNEKEGSAKYEKVLDKTGVINWGGLYVIRFDNGEGVKYECRGESIVK